MISDDWIVANSERVGLSIVEGEEQSPCPPFIVLVAVGLGRVAPDHNIAFCPDEQQMVGDVLQYASPVFLLILVLAINQA